MDYSFQDKLQHRQPLEQSDIRYHLVRTPNYRPDRLTQSAYNEIYGSIVYTAKDEVCSKYGAKFYKPSFNYGDRDKIHYYLFGLIDPAKIDQQLINAFASALQAPNSRVNIAMLYSYKSRKSVDKLIVKLDKELGVNTIFQDNVIVVNGKKYITISSIDVADNMVCETSRIKYKAVQSNSENTVRALKNARREAQNDVYAMQDLYKKYQLWHRSPYDGAFMFRTSYGWLTTATRTPKDNVQRDDLSLVLGFDESTDTITYAGDRLPSSDLPEFLVLTERNEDAIPSSSKDSPVLKYMAHFHKNEITRNPLFKDYAIPFYRYGVSESGHKFADELLINKKATNGINIHGKGRGFIISEHGLVRMGTKIEHFENFLKEFGLKSY